MRRWKFQPPAWSVLFGISAAVLFLPPIAGFSSEIQMGREPEMKKLTPMITVDVIEPCLGFWEKIGFEKTMEVPGEGGLVFAALASGPVEVMYQTLATVVADLPALAGVTFGASSFFLEVESLAAVQEAVEGGGEGEVLVHEKETFYGSKEMVVRAPCGTIVVFAEMAGGEGQ